MRPASPTDNSTESTWFAAHPIQGKLMNVCLAALCRTSGNFCGLGCRLRVPLRLGWLLCVTLRNTDIGYRG
jgi:hypothetical protein